MGEAQARILQKETAAALPKIWGQVSVTNLPYEGLVGTLHAETASIKHFVDETCDIYSLLHTAFAFRLNPCTAHEDGPCAKIRLLI